MKYAQLTQLDQEQLAQKIKEQQILLRKLRFAHSLTPLENPMLLRKARRLLARMESLFNPKKS